MNLPPGTLIAHLYNLVEIHEKLNHSQGLTNRPPTEKQTENITKLDTHINTILTKLNFNESTNS